MTSTNPITAITIGVSNLAVAPQGQQPNSAQLTASATAAVAGPVLNAPNTIEQATNGMLDLAVATQGQQPIGAVPANAPQGQESYVPYYHIDQDPTRSSPPPTPRELSTPPKIKRPRTFATFYDVD